MEDCGCMAGWGYITPLRCVAEATGPSHTYLRGAAGSAGNGALSAKVPLHPPSDLLTSCVTWPETGDNCTNHVKRPLVRPLYCIALHCLARTGRRSRTTGLRCLTFGLHLALKTTTPSTFSLDSSRRRHLPFVYVLSQESLLHLLETQFDRPARPSQSPLRCHASLDDLALFIPSHIKFRGCLSHGQIYAHNPVFHRPGIQLRLHSGCITTELRPSFGTHP